MVDDGFWRESVKGLGTEQGVAGGGGRGRRAEGLQREEWREGKSSSGVFWSKFSCQSLL